MHAPDVALPTSPLAESLYTSQIKEFYAALANDQPARVTAEDGVAAVRIALAAVESARTGRAVHLARVQEAV